MRPRVLVIALMLYPCASLAQTGHEAAQYTTYGDLLKELEAFAQHGLEQSAVLRAEFSDLQASHGVAGDDETFREYVRVRMVFEAVRDAGLWQIHWSVTDKDPNSDSIWRQWASPSERAVTSREERSPTAIAECDELSALFAFVSRGLGVKHVGLFWPTWNHTVAVWTTRSEEGQPVRIVIPTSQIFISPDATIGTREFDPYTQTTIYDYDRKDIEEGHELPLQMAEFMIGVVKQHAGKASSFLQARRNERSKRFGGS